MPYVRDRSFLDCTNVLLPPPGSLTPLENQVNVKLKDYAGGTMYFSM